MWRTDFGTVYAPIWRQTTEGMSVIVSLVGRFLRWRIWWRKFRKQLGHTHWSAFYWIFKGRFTRSMPFPCRAHAVPMSCRAAKGLECVFPIWFTQCGRVWFTIAMPCSDHAVLLKATAQHGRRETAVLCCGLEKNGMVGAWHRRGMVSVN